ncbi:glycosyltransferase [Vibrio vulnificus]|uniref:glycosyltransferase n=1 Tax=Vibrio vulnificus TaxID=672 RepID=UPI001A2AE308|nr:glycosyltransferase [Vibrio vulnificus]EGR0111095.1 glycosyltransferase [Vibrio vulnificus]EIF5015765.1 glycosyltransferase [Vibrio vulnificus]EIO2321772.1 glycosyltransferase [Vibrio vulnificus]EIO4067715.1 glycosyltransferase [Vibrio vulnificus]EJO9867912.1 glycosyltransferase [Vibrio vulnificus]
MRIDVHLITNLAQVAGAENMMLRLIERNHLKSEARQVVVSLMYISEEVKSKLPSGVEVYALNASTAITMLFSSLKLARLLREGNNLYCWMYHANVIGALAKILKLGRIKLFWGVRHSLDDYKGESVSTKVAIQVGRLLGKIPDRVIYCSQRAQKQHEAFGYNVAEKSIYIPNGYNFPPIIERCFSRTSLTFGAAGRFHDAKDYKTLTRAIAPILDRNPEATLKMCGRDITENNGELTGMLEQAGIKPTQVILMGQQEDMAAFYNQIDVFILSSKTEGFPNVLAEAAAHGCAVFSTDVGDASVIVNNLTHIVPVADSIALTQAIENYLSLPSEQRKAIAFATTQHVRSQFSISHIAEQFFALGR